MLWQVTAHRVFTVVVKMYLNDHITPATGKTLTVLASKAGGAASAISGTSAEIVSVAGLYKIDLATADTNTMGALVLHVASAGCDDLDVPCQVTAEPEFTVFSVNDGAAGTQSFITDLPQVVEDYWKDCDVVFLTGNLSQQRKRVTRYEAAQFKLHFSGAFTGAPANGDKAVLVNS